jgi:putative ABC transport system permease protein
VAVHPSDLVAPALESLRAHRLRSGLSALGMVVGIATIVAAIAIREGARREAVAEIGALGVNNLFIRAVRPTAAAAAPAPAPSLTVADARMLEASLPNIEAVAVLRSAPTVVETPAAHEPVTMLGVTPSWRAVAGVRIDRGRWITDADAARPRRVAVVGDGLAARLFGSGCTSSAEVRPFRAVSKRHF